MDICKNCKFSKPVQDDRNFLETHIKKIDEQIEKEQKELTFNQIRALVETKRILQVRLMDMDEMIMCHRYPTPMKYGIKHWCGEFKNAFWKM